MGDSVDPDLEGDFEDSGLQEDSVDFGVLVALGLGDLLHMPLFYIFVL